MIGPRHLLSLCPFAIRICPYMLFGFWGGGLRRTNEVILTNVYCIIVMMIEYSPAENRLQPHTDTFNFWLFQRGFNLTTYNSCHLSSTLKTLIFYPQQQSTPTTQLSNDLTTVEPPPSITVSNHTKAWMDFRFGDVIGFRLAILETDVWYFIVKDR